MHVLLTRPERDSADLMSRIEALGCRVSLAPLLEIELLPMAGDALSGARALVATSRNGLRALASSPAMAAAQSLPLFVVGPATAALAAKLGFQDIREGAGTAAELSGLIEAASVPGPLFHLAGDHLAFDLAAALAAKGINLTALASYRSVAAKTLPEGVILDLAHGRIDAVILMSPRSARTWAHLAAKPDLRSAAVRVTHICMSQAVVDALESLRPDKALVALRPTAEEIVALVYRLADGRRSG